MIVCLAREDLYVGALSTERNGALPCRQVTKGVCMYPVGSFTLSVFCIHKNITFRVVSTHCCVLSLLMVLFIASSELLEARIRFLQSLKAEYVKAKREGKLGSSGEGKA